MKKVLLAVAGLVVGMTLSAQVSLSFNPEVGATYEYTSLTTQKLKQSVMGQEVNTDQKIEMVTTLLPTEKVGDNLKVTVTFKDLFFEVVSPMMAMKYDSKNVDKQAQGINGMLISILGSIVGQQFTMVVAPDGSVTELTGMNAILNNMMSTIQGTGMEQLAEGLAGQFSDDAMQASFSQAFQLYSQPIRVGDTWEEERTMVSGGLPLHTKTQYIFQRMENGLAMIASESTLAVEGGQMSGTQAGEAGINIQTGLPESGQATSCLKGTITQQGMEIQMNIESKTTSSVKKL